MRTLAAAYSIRAHVCALYALVFLLVYKGAGGQPFSALALAWAAWVYLSLQTAYILNRIEDITEDEINGDPFSLSPELRRAALLAAPVLLTLLAGIALLVHRAAWPVLVYGLALIPLYSLPSLPLKRFLLFKPLLLTAGFFLISFFLPISLVSGGSAGFWRSLPALLSANWPFPAFFFLNSVFLDLRDVRGDAAAGISTFPGVLGARSAALTLSAASAALAAVFFARGAAIPAVFSLFFSAASAGALRLPGRDYYNSVILLEAAACLYVLLY